MNKRDWDLLTAPELGDHTADIIVWTFYHVSVVIK